MPDISLSELYQFVVTMYSMWITYRLKSKELSQKNNSTAKQGRRITYRPKAKVLSQKRNSTTDKPAPTEKAAPRTR